MAELIAPNQPTQERATQELKYAGFWVRSWAISIDQIIILIFVLICLAIGASFVHTQNLGEQFSMWVMNFLAEKMQGLQNMPLTTPDQMQDSLSVMLRKLDVALSYYILPLQIVFNTLYFAIPESSKMQGSIGKYCMKIKIINLQGEKISFFRAFCRNLTKTVPGYFYFILSIVIFVPIIFDKKKRGFHDMLCGTLVVYK